jgi:hypothetical protein
LRRGRSSALAAHSRNLEANSAEPPTSVVTTSSISSGSKSTSAASGGSASVSGMRITIPSSPAIACASIPNRSRRRAPIASAQGPCTAAP